MKCKILIIDDSQLNREFLGDILNDEYHILLAENGVQGIALIKENMADLSLVLLDLVMPDMDGFEVLNYMNSNGWIHDIPVMMISSQTDGESVTKAYELGASDFINRPFNVNIVRKRVSNIISLFSKQRKLKDIVTEQIYEKEKRSSLMIAVLSHIVEFRNGESGLHILHINTITQKLLMALSHKHPELHLDYDKISLITMASSLHDIGKISIADNILNKPGRLTNEEFEVMKTHSYIGAQIIAGLKWNQQDPLLKTAYEICRWHHERWDGKGYPDGLNQNEIPLSAQVVSLADVYDALVSERCYKKAIPHVQAIKMIVEGKCGSFNPLLIECLLDIEDGLEAEMVKHDREADYFKEMVKVTSELEKLEDMSVNQQVLFQLELEKQKNLFFTEKIDDISFVYNHMLEMLMFSKRDALRLGLKETIVEPLTQNSILSESDRKKLKQLIKRAQKTNSEKPEFQFQSIVKVDGIKTLCHFSCQAMWYKADKPVFMGIVGMIDKAKAIGQLSLDKIQQLNILDIKENNNRLTFMQAKKMLKELKQNFSFVRFVSCAGQKSFFLDDNDEIVYSSQRIFLEDDTMSKSGYYRIINNEVYYMMTKYFEIDSQPYILEIAVKTDLTGNEKDYYHDHLFKSFKNMHEQLYCDGLTKAYNRRYLDEKIYDDKSITAVAMIDLDRFKDINDRYGHHIGDKVLKKTVEVIKNGIRDKDALIRYGGDEFVILFVDIPLHIIERRLNQIRSDVEKLNIDRFEKLKINCSIGCAVGKGKVDQMIIVADDMLYQAKLTRNTVAIKYIEADE